MSDEWKAALWDTPKSGARYCVRSRDPSSHDGWRYADDGRGNVLTLGSRDEAAAHADRLNAVVAGGGR